MSTGERDVLTSLPRTRPTRRSAKRGAPGGAATEAKPTAKAAPRKAKAAAKPKAAAASRTEQAPKPKVPPAGYAVPRQEGAPTPGRTELVTTAVQALGEIAQIGATLGGQSLRNALGRITRR